MSSFLQIIKMKLGGAFPLETSTPSYLFGIKRNFEVVESILDLSRIFYLSSFDPRVSAVFIDLGLYFIHLIYH